MAKTSKPIIVTVSDDALKHIQEVADQLATKGMRVNQVIPAVGVIIGSYSAEHEMSALAEVEGVTSVENEVAAELPPPDSQVQ